MQRRFNELKRVIKEAIVDQDCFGLVENHAFRVYAKNLTPPNHEQFKFSTKEEKVNAFMTWLREQEAKGLLQTTTINQLGKAIKQPWTNLYISDSYKRGVQRARYEMGRIGMSVPGIDVTGGIAASMSTPYHMDRVGMMYTRTFEDLKGITASMDSQISRVLSQGMVDGDGPALLAKKLTDTIGGRLGIKNESGKTTMSPESRAKILARTEVIRAHHSATIQEYRNWGVEGVDVEAELRTAGDSRVCSQCKELEGKVYTLDEAEGLIPVHPGCRCITIPTMPGHKKSLPEPNEIEKEGILKSILNSDTTLTGRSKLNVEREKGISLSLVKKKEISKIEKKIEYTPSGASNVDSRIVGRILAERFETTATEAKTGSTYFGVHFIDDSGSPKTMTVRISDHGRVYDSFADIDMSFDPTDKEIVKKIQTFAKENKWELSDKNRLGVQLGITPYQVSMPGVSELMTTNGYIEAIEEGYVSVEDVIAIIKSADLEVPDIILQLLN